MHPDPNAHDAPAPDPDSTGHDARAHYGPPLAVTKYQVWHGEHAISTEYDHWTEAELFRTFDTPGTPDYTIKLVRVTDPTPDRRTPPRHPDRIV